MTPYQTLSSFQNGIVQRKSEDRYVVGTIAFDGVPKRLTNARIIITHPQDIPNRGLAVDWRIESDLVKALADNKNSLNNELEIYIRGQFRETLKNEMIEPLDKFIAEYLGDEDMNVISHVEGSLIRYDGYQYRMNFDLKGDMDILNDIATNVYVRTRFFKDFITMEVEKRQDELHGSSY
jgi:hypothetical protein